MTPGTRRFSRRLTRSSKPATVYEVAADLRAAVTDPDHRGGHADVLNQLDDLVEHSALRVDPDGSPLTERLADSLDASHISGDLAALVERAIDAYCERADHAGAVLEAAVTALQGGNAGVEELAAYADDGHAHPHARALLYGVLAPDGDEGPATTLETAAHSFTIEEGARLQHVSFDHDDRPTTEAAHEQFQDDGRAGRGAVRRARQGPRR